MAMRKVCGIHTLEGGHDWSSHLEHGTQGVGDRAWSYSRQLPVQYCNTSDILARSHHLLDVYTPAQ